MITADLAAALLSGPRGRRLCLEVSGVEPATLLARLSAPPPGTRTSIRWQDSRSYPDRVLDRAARQIERRWAGSGQRPVVAADDLFAALDVAVAFAAYWEPPDEDDAAATAPQVREALLLVAGAVAEHGVSARWRRTVALTGQHHVGWRDRGGGPAQPPALTGAAERLARFRSAARARAEGSLWWSAPAAYGLVTTTATFAGDIPSGLVFVEDALGWTRARTTPLRARSPCRVLEITGPPDWVALVERFPLDVTPSRQRSWQPATGLDGPWFVPDWSAVAQVCDGVHLTTWGYLTTAGRALPVHGGQTMLAGWDPDTTYWLTDCLELAGTPRSWVRAEGADDPAFGWRERAAP